MWKASLESDILKKGGKGTSYVELLYSWQVLRSESPVARPVPDTYQAHKNICWKKKVNERPVYDFLNLNGTPYL